MREIETADFRRAHFAANLLGLLREIILNDDTKLLSEWFVSSRIAFGFVYAYPG